VSGGLLMLMLMLRPGRREGGGNGEGGALGKG